MTRCLIHIGMEKTGSTSIQRFLHANAKQLRDAGIGFPLGVSGRINHNLLAAAYVPPESDRLSRGARSGQGAMPGFLARHRAEILAEIPRHDRVVISGEHLFRLTADEIGTFRSDLEKAGVREAKVICVLRGPASFYLSFVQQELKGSATFPAPDGFFVPYSDRAAGWLQHFDSEFLEFGSLASSDVGIVGAFVEQLKLVLDVGLIDLPRTVPIENDSLSPEEMQLVQDFRRRWFLDEDGLLNRPTTRLVEELRRRRDGTWRKPVLRPEIESLISDRHRNDLRRLTELTGISLPLTAPVSLPATPIDVQQVCAILANFDRALYDQVTARIRPPRFAGLGRRIIDLAGRIRERSRIAMPVN
jgi:hypothetical protein